MELSSIDTTSESGLREECGLFGMVAANSGIDITLSHLIHLGLVGLQHRGQESAGIVTSMGGPNDTFVTRKAMGLVNGAFSDDDIVILKGNLGIGHVRYSTQGLSNASNIQPFVVESLHGLIAVAHNGELVNAMHLKQKLLRHGVGLSTSSDSELITQLLTHTPDCGEPNGANWVGRIKNMMQETVASYSLLIMHKDRIWAVRDSYGNRPLCIGKLLPADAVTVMRSPSGNRLALPDESEAWIVASESCTFHAMGAEYVRDVLPGEIVEVTKNGVISRCIVPRPEAHPPAFCIFEYVYFARPDSRFEGQMVASVRRRCGRQLALEWPADVDLVSTVPESATPAAMEYAATLNIPYREVLCKNRYVGRTFIQPSARLRKLGVAKKFGPLVDNFYGKRLVIIDDSIVRGTTMGQLVALLRKAGAKEVHVRVASPPIKYPCYMGINIPTKEELVANIIPLNEMAKLFGADSVHYLSLEGLKKAVTEGLKEGQETGHCTACLSGDYPVKKLDW
ncbi:amidophosphoribosyltransferase [Biomphalaria glabrata]|uniref:Amidophosphoribosyltransferase n=1 Tax=Biomphalaria glabrata TaxID=6526 RepID=A0A9W3B5J6_BIOGL|nr:amidophosphoribosyltransferase-like isoform X1 [Biomphalaria glabrata]XP_055894751.1 amidophosphoribosyltransferase-like isoform X1 [Biomphalaria glabrata]XP_055894752.1 amidophosphoribosyltransferase-like isoform X1 [Biomphalaria glabrata]KAI8727439.1 amidophosphoribosyltransferase-like [Biomphalaria glabrata]KAI8799193.1 amidophosphoribosyltransferase [Biomphalaria glabrata]